ncbi:MAG: serine/threonine-protein kinase [Rhodoglobus sp.]
MTTPLARGTLLAGRYRIDGLVGHGGMSSVYRAADTSLGRDVAIKIFRPELASSEDLLRQDAEIRLIASLSHPCLVTLFDATTDEEGPAFLVMRYVAGQDLRSALKAGPLDPVVTAEIGADIASALAYLAHHGVVHRDVKPGNILLGAPGPHESRAVLADFGIARLVDATRLTSTGEVIGTASYLSPEQALGGEVDSTSDVYSLGLVLLECLTGVRSFPGSPAESAMARLQADPGIPEELDPTWRELLAAMTQREPGDRITAEEVTPALRRLGDQNAENPTLRMPTAAADAADAVTERMVEDRPTERLGVEAEPPRPVRAPRPRAARAPRSRGGAKAFTIAGFVALGTVALAILLVGGSWALGQVSATFTEVQYPAVDGDLGVHLDQLQQSVAP